ncbi:MULTISPECIES: glycoside hydrolase family 3 protein [unclassified Streptomyces]|uniref:glycoside hydrolase family 3 protein n=1 Tax=unclassified Streptomyces TaxID=2593676 RepID=UPI0022594633|nr:MULTISPECIES: glycoside hydrolase family 3 protein [unclassified Streptomyces]MCX5333689.1 glycoside hydrolase family 3 C-terminal domain-containing protein [Streptomyces sp. NBC_00140]MCX5363160.1 glycoside hydrolase family 3 C-terminal domain-containing protein [Streptomyces sp. NBC_00124]
MKGSKRRRSTLVVALALIAGLGATVPSHADTPYPFRDPSLTVDGRVDDLLDRLTLDEKISLLHQYQPAVPRLGIESFRTGTEALHGVAWLGETTVFPQAVGLASTWDPALMEQVGSAVGDEARGFQQERPAGWGLNLWAPVVNLLRDPRWGRNEEGYSEDPELTGALSTAYGEGLTGGDPDHLKTAPTIKHYLANNNEWHRTTTSSDLRPRVAKEYDEAAFKPAIEANAATGVMSSYNLVNGRPATVNPDLDGVVRKWTSYDLLNVTDAFAPGNLPGDQKYYPSVTEGDAAAMKAGIDSFTDNDANSSVTTGAIKSALQQGLLKESDVEEAAGHILSVRVRLGEFDPGGGKYGSIDKSVINSPAHQKLARKAATEGAVLLKNQTGTLPLKKSAKDVAVVGPLADTLYTDWYSGTLPYAVTPADGIAAKLGTAVTTNEGVDRIALKNAETGRYVTAGTDADGEPLKETSASDASAQFDVFDWGAGIVTLRSAANGKYVGYNWANFVNDQVQPNSWYVQQQFKLEEQTDGTYLLRYAGYETEEPWWGNPVYLGPTGADGTLGLVAKDAAAHYTKDVVRSGVDEAVAAVKGKDNAVVVVGSNPSINGREAHDRTDMGLAPAQEALVRAVKAANPRVVVIVENSYPTTLGALQKEVPAVLWTSHAGQETGNALADLLYGDANPSGRLTQTWYRSESDLPSILDYDIIKSDRTYQYFKGSPLYPFGHGLSYTSFRYGDLRKSADGYEVKVTNTGSRTGDEVVQLYAHQRVSRDKQPLKQLEAFQRVTLKPGETKTVRLKLAKKDLAHWDVTRSKWVVEQGTYDVLAGSSSADIRTRTTWQVSGETIPARDLSRTTRAENFDDYDGTRLVDESKERGTAVGVTADRAWLKYGDARLGSGASRFTARVAGASGTVEVRLGSPTGTLAGTAAFAGTSSPYAYETVTADLSRAAKGRTDVYLVLKGAGLRLATFSLH